MQTSEIRAIIKRLDLPIGERARKIDPKYVEKIKQAVKGGEKNIAEQKPAEPEKPKLKENEIGIPPKIQVKTLAERMKKPVTEVIKHLIQNGIFAAQNETIEYDVAAIIAEDFGLVAVEDKEAAEEADDFSTGKIKELLKEKDESKLVPRPPIVVVVGHVDHGKTTLLDSIRETQVVEGESGGITQHIAAYEVETNGQSITFLDTPGHEAFSAMRRRGTSVTDVAILIVAANDSVKPQTIEAINFAREANIPIVVAINKIDLPEANVEKTKKDLSEIGLIPEDWSGDTVMVEISAKKKTNLDKLLESVLLVAEVAEPKANPDRPAVGAVLESHIEKGGVVATVLILTGTLNINDPISAGGVSGVVRQMRDYRGQPVTTAGPSKPVLISGLNAAPAAGEIMQAETDITSARRKAEGKKEEDKTRRLSKQATQKKEDTKTVNLVIKADVQGSLEAIVQTLESLPSDEVSVAIVKKGVGKINDSDIKTAVSTGAAVVGFHVDSDPIAAKMAENEDVIVKKYDVIYHLVEDITTKLTELLSPEKIRTVVGRGKILAIFKQGKGDMIVGGKVTKGEIQNKMTVEIFRNKESLGEGKISQLQANKQSVPSVSEGKEFGITLSGSIVIQEGDVIEAFRVEERKRSLDE
ncbi:translation initiation factor IF-2 [Patescibacteria group bacterium]